MTGWQEAHSKGLRGWRLLSACLCLDPGLCLCCSVEMPELGPQCHSLIDRRQEDLAVLNDAGRKACFQVHLASISRTVNVMLGGAREKVVEASA